MRRLSLILALFALAGCAKTPESIAPAYVSDFAYDSWKCDQLVQEQARLASALATASAAQNDARSSDIVGVLLIGVPVSTLSGGNIAPEIARLKGNKDAVDKTIIKKNCSS